MANKKGFEMAMEQIVTIIILLVLLGIILIYLLWSKGYLMTVEIPGF